MSYARFIVLSSINSKFTGMAVDYVHETATLDRKQQTTINLLLTLSR